MDCPFSLFLQYQQTGYNAINLTHPLNLVIIKTMKTENQKIFIGILKNSGITVTAFSVCTAICFLLDYFKINDLNFLIIYILGILLTSVLTKHFVYSVILSIVSVLGYNFFFTVPRYTFNVDDHMYIVTFVLMFAIGLVISSITFQLKKSLAQVTALNIEKIKLKNDAEKEQIKATLLKSISHDLRTPLTTIKNGAKLIYEKTDLDINDRQEILNDIISKSEWTVKIIENLLSLTRINSEKLTVKKSKEALEEIVPQAVRTVNGLLGNRKIHYEMPEEMLLIPMDAVLIIQVISNILSNAIKHTNDNGNIWIKVWNTGKNTVFRIVNDGLLIREEDLPHLFEMYYTTEDYSTGGIGLGLTICKLIVTAHGGQIEARNSDKKVVFEFTLPMETGLL